MKLFFLSLLCAFTFSLSAQSEPYEKEVTMSLGTHPAVVLDMTEIDAKDALMYWEDYMKEYSKIKRNKKADEYYGEGVSVPLISTANLDLYSKIEDLKGNSRLYLWVDNGGAFISSSSDPEAMNNLKTFISDFAISSEKRHVESLLEVEMKNLTKFEKDLKGLQKDKSGYEKEIEDAKEKIMKNEKNIEENKVAQEAKVDEIDGQNSVIERIKERLAKIGKVNSKM